MFVLEHAMVLSTQNMLHTRWMVKKPLNLKSQLNERFILLVLSWIVPKFQLNVTHLQLLITQPNILGHGHVRRQSFPETKFVNKSMVKILPFHVGTTPQAKIIVSNYTWSVQAFPYGWVKVFYYSIVNLKIVQHPNLLVNICKMFQAHLLSEV